MGIESIRAAREVREVQGQRLSKRATGQAGAEQSCLSSRERRITAVSALARGKRATIPETGNWRSRNRASQCSRNKSLPWRAFDEGNMSVHTGAGSLPRLPFG